MDCMLHLDYHDYNDDYDDCMFYLDHDGYDDESLIVPIILCTDKSRTIMIVMQI